MKFALTLCVLACFAVAVSAQSVSISWSGGTVNFYNYNYTSNSTGGYYTCAPNPVNYTVVGTASGSGATVGSLGCVKPTTTSVWQAPYVYTVSCQRSTVSVSGLSVTTNVLSGTEYATADGCNANPKTGATGRILVGTSVEGSTGSLNTLGQCTSSYGGTGSYGWMNYIPTCPSSGSFATAIPSALVVVAALAVAFAANKQ
jgi:hypothetical protein